ncbi:transcription elongation factor GreA [Candidatus Microgenomates bacterium]|nr:transcription elongation factor GreA [Candidatus Microgenomates bacterium]
MAKNSHTTRKHIIHLTPQGITELKEECEEMLSKRPRVVERLANARSMGDLSENSDYTNAKEELEFLDGRIAELEHVLQNVIVIKKVVRKHVDLGAKVTVATNGERHIFHIVGEWEADPQEKKISHESPLGRALLGKKVGETVEVEAPVGRVVYKILSIE